LIKLSLKLRSRPVTNETARPLTWGVEAKDASGRIGKGGKILELEVKRDFLEDCLVMRYFELWLPLWMS
jgi:hypothetical protein